MTAGGEGRATIAVVDIDGVLADPGHRTHHLQSRPKDWDGFFAAVSGDTLIERGRSLVAELASEHEIVLLSGRPERTRVDTADWLARHGIGYSRLVLRDDDDHRPAGLMKADLIRAIGGPDVVGVVIDDEPGVVEALSRRGYTVRQFV